MSRALKLVAVLVTVAACTMVAIPSYYSIAESRLADRFQSIRLGSNKQLVLEEFGDPAAVSADCYVAQNIEYETPARWSAGGYASSCAFWLGPTARTYVVGFASTGEVVGVAYGDS
jgi:hypothetical protein